MIFMKNNDRIMFMKKYNPNRSYQLAVIGVAIGSFALGSGITNFVKSISQRGNFEWDIITIIIGAIVTGLSMHYAYRYKSNPQDERC